ncbi:steroid delta-isomerase [Saccharopolyspora erythraea NRRL 2338]|uniref:Steroid delta-isomerase n=2 Tax=Saccharopolyspora erythraea TaxID=1836 RepID=A4FI35_SACEN|nr:nuclear transport factor 2 family protein [Saccharopolyspora erythraea]PFG97393.1 steroid delta-isomerase [Saccharopolyspora erythraea NRRL 2338]QRK87574.1 nuclear transport factor 2 family protein [Saccharopolyspora erythraea]CAM03710.1 steroid delta-isomerase [Saccharopolyspora erythraea NRRL 2338]
MPSEPERKKVAIAYCERVTAGDVEGILELFEPDAVIEDPVGTGPVAGHDALREYYRNIVDNYGSRIETGEARGSHEDTFVALPIVVTATIGGKASVVNSVDVFEINDACRITRMWAYWGPSDIR